MKVVRTLVVVVLLAFQAAGAIAETQADTSPTRVVQGGRWTEGSAAGTYRIVVDEVGFEHVSCRVRIQWVAPAAAGRPARLVAEQMFTEVSTSFWSCGVGKQSVVVSGNVLKVQATHAYSGEPCTFTARLGTPGRYQYEAWGREFESRRPDQ
ncbi:hypothetical protein D9M68_627210 [compost metagenome]|uniref:Uncharacterized protein n=1 Tax=Achromobacter agilis TaxID=1353888 RepID=A0A446CN66_9BURK|nr:hypothetical protein [Achromobacter agilis]SSW69352.1 hypothetical protein AGI3411_04158 [Achromobacter agilis]